MKKNVSYHMKKLNLPGIEKWLGTFDSLGQTFDSSGECFASLRSEKQLSPSESKVCPLESKVCLTIFPSLASIFHVVGTYITLASVAFSPSHSFPTYSYVRERCHKNRQN